MSYILDALKKSDRERKQGEIPTLESVQDMHYGPRRHRRELRPVLLLGILALGVVLWGAWFFWGAASVSRTTVEMNATDETPRAVSVPVAVSDPPPLPTADVSPGFSPEEPREAENPAPAQIPLPSESTSATSAPVPVADDIEAAMTDSSAADQEQATPPDLISATPAPAEAPPVAEVTENAGNASDAADREQAPLPEIQADTRVVNLENLPTELKQELPEIKFGVHLYSENQTARRASINGRLLREGELVEPGLHLEEITRQGAILSFRGRRFRVAVFPR